MQRKKDANVAKKGSSGDQLVTKLISQSLTAMGSTSDVTKSPTDRTLKRNCGTDRRCARLYRNTAGLSTVEIQEHARKYITRSRSGSVVSLSLNSVIGSGGSW